MNKSTLDVALLQMTSVDNIEVNLQFIENSLKTMAPEQNIDLLCLPENCLFMRLKEGDKIRGLDLNSPIFNRLGSLAKEKKCHLHLGSTPLNLEGRLYNSSILITPTGAVTPTYQKIHLFDIQLEGRPPNHESDVFSSGSSPHTFCINNWQVGESICYDIRFSELYQNYAKQGVDIILIPAAFLVETGKAHWEILLRARAIESQCYVIAAAQGGIHENLEGSRRETFGHSMIIGPWGDIKAELSNTSGLSFFQLSKTELNKVRSQIPMKDHRRL